MGKFSSFFDRFRKAGARPGDQPEYIDLNAPAAPAAPGQPKEQKSWLARWKPESKRDRQIAWLQAGYSETLNLMRGIRDHLERQEDVQHKMVDVLGRLPDSMDNLKNVGKAAEQQVEVLGLLKQQLESSTRHDQQLIESMNRFNQTLGVMDETSRTSGRTVEHLMERSKDSESMLRRVIERSERRIIFITGIFLIAVLLGVGSVVYIATTRNMTAAAQPPAPVTVVTEPPAAAAPEAVPPPAEEPKKTRSLWSKFFGPKQMPD